MEYFHKFCNLILDFCVKTRTRFSLRDKQLFEITKVEITRVDYREIDSNCTVIFCRWYFHAESEGKQICHRQKVSTVKPGLKATFVKHRPGEKAEISYLEIVLSVQIAKQTPAFLKQAVLALPMEACFGQVQLNLVLQIRRAIRDN